MKGLIFSRAFTKKLEKKVFLSFIKNTFTGIFQGFCHNFENTFLHTAFLSCRKPPNLLQINSLGGI